jgi:hypothetical protein
MKIFIENKVEAEVYLERNERGDLLLNLYDSSKLDELVKFSKDKMFFNLKNKNYVSSRIMIK